MLNVAGPHETGGRLGRATFVVQASWARATLTTGGRTRLAPHLRTSRHGRLLRQRRAAAPARAARQAGRRGGQRARARSSPRPATRRAASASSRPRPPSARGALCPEAVFIPPDFEAYRERSRDVMAVLREHVERVEVVGLDEAYLDLSGFERPKAAARRVKAAVKDATGLGCSIGIGPNKLVAKVASDAEKPDGFVVLSAEEARERFAGSPPGLIPGIGPKTVERLERAGHRDARRARRALPDAAARRVVRPAPRAPPGPPGPLRGRSRHRDGARAPSPSRARRPSTATCAASASSSRTCGG